MNRGITFVAFLSPLLAMAIASFAAPPAIPSQPVKAPRPSESVEQSSCVTAQCHANVKAFKVQHTPVAMNNCDTCHELADAGKHTFTYPRQNQQMCTYCHEFDVSNVPVVHMPVSRGECTGCHDPHGGTDNRLFRENSLKDLCARCHENGLTPADKHLHKPFAEGGCDSCHASHASRFPKLLYAEGDSLCVSCHEDVGKTISSVKFVHKAMKEGCSRCHTSHGAPFEKQLRQPIATLCTDSCHEDVKKLATASKYKHSAVTQDKACLTCHVAHGSDLADLMPRPPISVCMTCHDQSVKTDRGYVVAALPELTNPKTVKHGPINDGLCDACHQVHGSNEPLLLARANASNFYQPMVPANYKLCFTCHDIRLATQKQTAVATQFRNGDVNLHFVHANDGPRGRNCRVCHSTHASTSPKHVNTSVQYGRWVMPVNFVRTETGGACTKSCHPPYSYDRERPVPPQSATRPATRTIVPVPVASTRASPSATFSGSLTTVTGQTVTVPRRDRPTVLVFLHPGSAQQVSLLRQIATAVPNPLRAQVILIVGGEKAAEEAKKLVTSVPASYGIVADADRVWFDGLEVSVWPTVLVLRPDGTPAWRTAGVPETLWVRLSAYVDFAAGKIDRGVLVQKLAAVTNATGEKKSGADQQLADARHLLAKGEPDKARKLLEQTLATQPSSVEVRAELARAYLQLDQPVPALNQLDALPPNAIPPEREQVLRAAALIKELRWPEAERMLVALVGKYPDCGEAHFLLGQLYERDRRFQDAAAEYRLAVDRGRSKTE